VTQACSSEKEVLKIGEVPLFGKGCVFSGGGKGCGGNDAEGYEDRDKTPTGNRGGGGWDMVRANL